MELKKDEVKEMDGYRIIPHEKYSIMVDKRLKCRPRVQIYLNERGSGNPLEIEGLEL